MKAMVRTREALAMLFAVVVLAGCAGSRIGGGAGEDVVAMPLTNTYWQLVRVAGQPVPESGGEQNPHILFLDDGRVSGFSGCNRFMGDYRVEGDHLIFDSMGSTRRACPDNQTEGLLFGALAKTAGVNLTGIELRLLGEQGAELAVFEATRMK